MCAVSISVLFRGLMYLNNFELICSTYYGFSAEFQTHNPLKMVQNKCRVILIESFRNFRAGIHVHYSEILNVNMFFMACE